MSIIVSKIEFDALVGEIIGNPEAALRLENEKLKLALKRIASIDPDDCYGSTSGGLKICRNIATQALI